MDRMAVSRAPKWERDVLLRWGIAMMKSAPTVHDASTSYAAPHPAFTREDVLTMTAEQMGMA